MNIRPRRNRKSSMIRDLVQENWLMCQDLIYPLFLVEGERIKQEVVSMPGIFRFSSDQLYAEIEYCLKKGLRAFALFPCLEEDKKDAVASESYQSDNFYLKSIEQIKLRFPEAVIVSDVAMDPYSSDGHDGLVKNGEILNDPTLKILGKMALAQAQAGADIIAPSDMMDGRVAYLRKYLDQQHLENVSIMSYTAKYASALYGPFRDALDSAPKLGDKKTYQMNPANSKEALLEASLDACEGADFLMVKPAGWYLDIIHKIKEKHHLPVAAYQVSGEYAMIKAAEKAGYINGEAVFLEALMSIKRAGADVILSYFAKEYIDWYSSSVKLY